MKAGILVSDRFEERHRDALAAAAPDAARVVLRGGHVDGDVAAVEVAFFSGDLFPDRVRDFILALRDAPKLRWLHTFSAGVDNPWFQSLRTRGVRLSDVVGRERGADRADGAALPARAVARRRPLAGRAAAARLGAT